MTPTPTDADVERVVREALDAVAWARNSGNGSVSLDDIDSLTDAVDAYLSARAAIAAMPAPGGGDPNAAVRHEYVATLIDRIQRYDAADGRHCDASGASAYELLREAEEALADMLAIAAMPAPDAARVRELEDALRDGWLTIDSAPRDHALHAIWVADLDGCMEPVRWRWRTWKNIYTDTDIGFEPTHWCPTPSPPPALREGGNG
jgi:hypothetical protein